LFYISFLPQ